MKSTLKRLMQITVVFISIAIIFGCVPPGAVNAPAAMGTPPAGLAQAYDDAEWQVLSNEEGTIAYQIPAGQVPDVNVGDQLIHGDNLLEVVSILAKTDDALVVHTTKGNLGRLFPQKSIVDIDSETRTAQVSYQTEGRAVASSYTMPLNLKMIRETNEDGSETVLYDADDPARSITLIDVTSNTSIINIDKTFNQTIFDVSGSGSQSSGNVNVSYEGGAKLTLQERLKLGANFHLRLYLNWDAGINWVKHTSTVRWWLITWHTSTVVWYEAVPYSTLNTNIKASFSANGLVSAVANLECNGSVTGTYSLPLPVNLTINFAIGPVPVEIGYTPSLAVSAVATGVVTATTGASAGFDGEWGVQCTNSGWSKINTLNTYKDFIPPSISASASISIIPKIENELRVGIGFANTGVFGTVTVSPYLSMTANAGLTAADRIWDVSWGIQGDVGVKASVVGYDLGSYNAQIFNLNWPISTGTY